MANVATIQDIIITTIVQASPVVHVHCGVSRGLTHQGQRGEDPKPRKCTLHCFHPPLNDQVQPQAKMSPHIGLWNREYVAQLTPATMAPSSQVAHVAAQRATARPQQRGPTLVDASILFRSILHCY